MAANHWAQCPKCMKLAMNRKAALTLKIQEAYGKVPMQGYQRLVIEEQQEIKLEDTLREDYEIGIRDGEFSVSYSGSCEECGFKKEFKKTEPIVI